MALTDVVDHQRAQVAYVIGAGVIALGAASFAVASDIPAWMLAPVALLYLGPLGLAAFILASTIALFAVELPAGVVLSLSVIGSVGIAFVNVISARQWRLRKHADPAIVGSALRQRGWDRLYGSILFVLAGGAFIALSIAAGYAAFFAEYEVNASNTVDRSDEVELVTSVAWWLGLLVAVVGLVRWRVRLGQHQRIFSWGALDFAAMLGLIAAVVHVSR
ncbi:hypothetical protein [Salinibacterium sp. PAMC 21357]|uniref:hypothetical protein n=1 Tax=Salinibacterium sp. PAMC 21357 TaxID=1112215 RepID=UPI00028A2720|nr:hypothetical protein [Salinibacterium sp. PAMC 21357]